MISDEQTLTKHDLGHPAAMKTEDKIFVAPNTELAAVTMADMAPGSFDSLMRSLGMSDPSRLLSSKLSWGSCSRRRHNPERSEQSH
jgi:hypothetical protein